MAFLCAVLRLKTLFPDLSATGDMFHQDLTEERYETRDSQDDLENLLGNRQAFLDLPDSTPFNRSILAFILFQQW